MRSIFSFLLTFILFSTTAAQSRPTNYKEALRMIDVWLDGKHDFDKLPGLSIAIVNDQDIIFSKGYGYADVEKKVPMQPETICSICSISKLFTSVAIMGLWEQGKLRLDDSISALLPSFDLKQQYSETLPITIRSLLTHSSGLPREADYPYWSEPFYFPTEKEVNSKLSAEQTLYPSSTYFQYSNLGMALLGQIVARVSGTAYSDYVEKNMLQPLRLTNTHPFLPKDLWRGKMAAGYSALYRDGTRKMMPFFEANGITPAAGYSSTVIDLAHFASWQLRVLNGSKEILRPSTLKEMQRVQWVNPDGKTTWGLGFIVNQVNGATYVGHGGSCPGFRSSLMISPKTKLGVSIMINAQGSSPEKYMFPIFEILNKASTDVMDTMSKNVDLDAYAGNYDEYAWSGEIAILPWKGKLTVIDLVSDKPFTDFDVFRWVSKDKFRKIRSDDGSLGEELSFERDANGKVIKVWRHNNFAKKLN